MVTPQSHRVDISVENRKTVPAACARLLTRAANANDRGTRREARVSIGYQGNNNRPSPVRGYISVETIIRLSPLFRSDDISPIPALSHYHIPPFPHYRIIALSHSPIPPFPHYRIIALSHYRIISFFSSPIQKFSTLASKFKSNNL